jgi:Transposase DDE domain
MNVRRLWSIWQALVLSCVAGCFTGRGRQRFVQWATGLALNAEEHTITQSLIGLGQPGDWRNLESFAEYGSWDLIAVQQACARRVASEPAATWHGYLVWAGDDTKVHRNSEGAWGVCTFHEYSARCPNRATTVRAHNWVILGSLQLTDNQPALFLPTAGRLYFRKSQLPPAGSPAGQPPDFRTKCELLVELGRQHAKAVPGKHLLVFDGGYALASVVRPLLKPDDPAQPRIDFVTRLRHDARLHLPPPAERKPGQKGRTPLWGKRLAPPRQGGRWPGAWKTGRVFAYGKVRQVRYKEVLCQWRPLGHDVLVRAVVAQVEGYDKRFTLVSSALSLTALQIIEVFCARFRQEDGFRDLKQQLGWEECRAWTRNPIERATQTLLITLSVLRLLQRRLDEEEGDEWWLHPPWNRRKQRPSVLDVERLLRRHARGISRCLAQWLQDSEKTAA